MKQKPAATSAQSAKSITPKAAITCASKSGADINTFVNATQQPSRKPGDVRTS